MKKQKYTLTTIEKKDDGITMYYINEILVATKVKGIHHFHSVSADGKSLSALRDKEKIGYVCKWNEEGLQKLFGKVDMVITKDTIDYRLSCNGKFVDFPIDDPDYRTGYNGNLFSKQMVKEAIIKFYNKTIPKNPQV